MKKNAGFTIVEMILYMGLLTIMMMILTRMFTGIVDVQLESQASSAVEEDGRYIFSRLAYDIGRASNIITPASLGSQTSVLTLTIGGVSYTYAVSENNLTLTNDQGSDVLNGQGTSISNFAVTRLGNTGGKHALRVQLTITSTTEGVAGVESKTVETTMALR